jgi:transposase InsO family protein
VENIKGVGHIYQQTFIDAYSKAACCKLYGRKNALATADMLNDVVIPFFDSHELPLLRVLTDRGSGYCGNREHHEYALYLEVENIDRTRTKAKSPQTNGICERFNKTCKDEFYAAAFRRKVYRSIAEIQLDLDQWVRQYNEERTHSGKYCYGKTPMQTFMDSIPLAREKLIGCDETDGQPA